MCLADPEYAGASPVRMRVVPEMRIEMCAVDMAHASSANLDAVN